MPSACDEGVGPRKRPHDGRPLTPAQIRVLEFCAEYPKWHTLAELERIIFLRNDDIVVIPSLIELGHLRHNVALRAVQITYLGIAAVLNRRV